MEKMQKQFVEYASTRKPYIDLKAACAKKAKMGLVRKGSKRPGQEVVNTFKMMRFLK